MSWNIALLWPFCAPWELNVFLLRQTFFLAYISPMKAWTINCGINIQGNICRQDTVVSCLQYCHISFGKLYEEISYSTCIPLYVNFMPECSHCTSNERLIQELMCMFIINIVQHEEPKVSWMELDSTGSMLCGPNHWAPAGINMLRGLCCLFISTNNTSVYHCLFLSKKLRK